MLSVSVQGPLLSERTRTENRLLLDIIRNLPDYGRYDILSRFLFTFWINMTQNSAFTAARRAGDVSRETKNMSQFIDYLHCAVSPSGVDNYYADEHVSYCMQPKIDQHMRRNASLHPTQSKISFSANLYIPNFFQVLFPYNVRISL
jgi:hypothetical protein